MYMHTNIDTPTQKHTYTHKPNERKTHKIKRIGTQAQTYLRKQTSENTPTNIYRITKEEKHSQTQALTQIPTKI